MTFQRQGFFIHNAPTRSFNRDLQTTRQLDDSLTQSTRTKRQIYAMDWSIIWIWIGFFLFLIALPIIFRDDYRGLLCYRIRHGTWPTTPTTTQRTNLPFTSVLSDDEHVAILNEHVRRALSPFTKVCSMVNNKMQTSCRLMERRGVPSSS